MLLHSGSLLNLVLVVPLLMRSHECTCVAQARRARIRRMLKGEAKGVSPSH